MLFRSPVKRERPTQTSNKVSKKRLSTQKSKAAAQKKSVSTKGKKGSLLSGLACMPASLPACFPACIRDLKLRVCRKSRFRRGGCAIKEASGEEGVWDCIAGFEKKRFRGTKGKLSNRLDLMSASCSSNLWY